MQQWSAKLLRVAPVLERPGAVSSARRARRWQSTSTVAPEQNASDVSGLVGASFKSSSSTTRPSTGRTAPKGKDVDPYTLLANELSTIRENLFSLIGSSQPALTSIASYYFKHPSKQIRPLLVLLFSQATNGLGGRWEEKCNSVLCQPGELDKPLTRPDVLNDWNPSMPDHSNSFRNAFDLIVPPRHSQSDVRSTHHTSSVGPEGLSKPPYILPTQKRLAQLVEMIHVASLLHDDVIDESPLRRSAPSAPAAFGNKLSVLAGDFLLGRTSAALSRLGSSEAIELIASVISNLVEGEVLQMREVIGAESDPSKGNAEPSVTGTTTTSGSTELWNVYLQKTYMKTASLMAKGARAAVVLGGCQQGEIWKEVAYAYGRNLGIAFQLVDDILDYEAGEGTLGKPGGADLRLGLATGPALYAWEEHPALGPLIQRKFEKDGDIELARDLVRRSSGVERTRDLALVHAEKAREVLQMLPASDARRALEVLTERVVRRTW